jgi:hypothetical protein
MYEIYYYHEGCYYFQGRFSTMKEAKEKFDTELSGYIKKGEKILKRY